MKFWGKVRRYIQRGRKLGFPTANVNLNKKIPEGIYISKTKIGESIYPSLTFIGQARIAEIYILDFSKNIYDQWITVELIKKIRNNQKFGSVDDLIKQMKQDEQVARQFFTLD